MIDHHFFEEQRRETPGLKNSVHLNHSGASLFSRRTYAAMQQHFVLESKVGPMEAAIQVATRLVQLRERTARLINAKPKEIALMPSGAAAFGAVFSSMPPLREGDIILVGRHEWGGNLSTYERAAIQAGARIEVIPCKVDGSVNAEALALQMRGPVRLISLTWLPANGGLINDASAVGKIARQFNVPYFIDAGQAFCHLPIDVEDLQCDVLFAAGRKRLRGPRGTALLYVREKFLKHLNPTYVDVLSAPRTAFASELREDARKFETSETPVALWLGFANAIDEALEIGIENIAVHEITVAKQLRSRLAELPGVKIQDLGSDVQSGIVSFTMDGIDAFLIKSQLGCVGVQIASNGVAYTPLDMKARGLEFIARASVSHLNDEQDLDRFIAAVKALRA